MGDNWNIVEGVWNGAEQRYDSEAIESAEWHDVTDNTFWQPGLFGGSWPSQSPPTSWIFPNWQSGTDLTIRKAVYLDVVWDTWSVGYRPTKIRFDHTNGILDEFRLWDTDIGSHGVSTTCPDALVPPFVGTQIACANGYLPNQELDITYKGSSPYSDDIYKFWAMDIGGAGFQITKIEVFGVTP